VALLAATAAFGGLAGRLIEGGFHVHAADQLNEKDANQLVRPDPRTFAEYCQTWLAEYADVSCGQKTAERYREMLAHVCRAVGSQPLSKLTTLQLQRVYNQLLKDGKKIRIQGGQTASAPYSIKTVHNIHGVVHVALETAIDWGLISVNPASRCKLPPIPKREPPALDFPDSSRLLESCAEHWLSDFVIVETASGPRRGEPLALTWRDVGIDYSSITISKSLGQTKAGLYVKQTKGNNIRTIPLPQDARDALRRVKAAQEENRALYGASYRSDLDLVFCHPDGSYIRPDTVTKAVRRIALRAGFSGVSLHTLRHSWGSQLLSAGVPLPTVSKLLGHTDVYTTARIYSHSLRGDEATAAQKWEAAMNPQKAEAQALSLVELEALLEQVRPGLSPEGYEKLRTAVRAQSSTRRASKVLPMPQKKQA
jgi:integrase